MRGGCPAHRARRAAPRAAPPAPSRVILRHAPACSPPLHRRRFEQKGFKLVALKMMQADEALLKEHYKVLRLEPARAASWHAHAPSSFQRACTRQPTALEPPDVRRGWQNIANKPFFPEVLAYMTAGPVVPMIWEGDGVVKAGRAILGATKPSGTSISVRDMQSARELGRQAAGRTRTRTRTNVTGLDDRERAK